MANSFSMPEGMWNAAWAWRELKFLVKRPSICPYMPSARREKSTAATTMKAMTVRKPTARSTYPAITTPTMSSATK